MKIVGFNLSPVSLRTIQMTRTRLQSEPLLHNQNRLAPHRIMQLPLKRVCEREGFCTGRQLAHLVNSLRFREG